METNFIKLTIVTVLLFFQMTVIGQKTAIAPIEYIANQGQWDGDFMYKAITPKGDIYLKQQGFRIMLSDIENKAKIHGVRHNEIKAPQTLKYHCFDIHFDGSNSEASTSTEKSQKHYYNYFLGNDQSRWKSEIHPVQVVNYQNLYSNINLHVYSEDFNVKYDFIVKPGGNPNDIQVSYSGLEGVRMEKNKLYLKTSLGELIESIPYSYQYINGERREVSCRYQLNDGKVTFKLDKGYDPSVDLYIDPVLVFCSFTGSTADNWGYTATYDSVGNFYAGGIVGYSFPTPGTFQGNYPTTVGAIQTTFGGGGPGGMGSQFRYDASFTKYNAAGTTVLFATYFGGADNDQPHSIIVDNLDQLCIAGRTYSSNFPVTNGCYDNTFNGGGDMFVAKFNPSGTALVGSTYVGGSGDDGVNEEAQEFIGGVLKHNYADDARSEIIFDASNNVYVAGCTESINFPVTGSAFQASNGGSQDGVIIQLNNNLTSLLWSTYVGGTNNDAAYVLTIDKSDPSKLYVGGGTMSTNFPTTSGTHHATYQGGTVDGFLMRFNSISKALVASTFIGTNQYDQVYGVQTDSLGGVFCMGQTLGAYPVVGSVYSNPGSAQFVSKLNATLTTLQVSTVYGSGSTVQCNISPNAFLVDKCNNVYVSGWGGNLGFVVNSSTTGMPTTTNALQPNTDGNDFYFIVFDQNLSSLLYGSFFGQVGGVSEHVDGGTSRFDSKGVIYQAICAACGGSQVFPTSAGVAHPTNLSTNCNLAALKIDFQLQDPNAIANVLADSVGCAPFVVQFVNNSSSATGYVWDFGDGSPTSTQLNPTHTYTTPGTYTVTLTANNPNGCNVSISTDQIIIKVLDDSVHAAFTYAKIDSCGPFTASFFNTSTTVPGSGSTVYTWNFGDGTTSSAQFPPIHNFPGPNTYTVTLTVTDSNACNSPSVFTAVVDYNVSFVSAAFDMPDTVCMPAVVNLIDQSSNVTTYNWNFGDGNTSNVSSPTNTFPGPGTYTVTLITANPNSCNKLDTASQGIHVFDSPVADFIWMPEPPTPNTPNTFTNLSVGATDYFWDFGDGSTSIEKDPVHVFEKDGTYNVCLTASNQVGCKDTQCKSVRSIVFPIVDVPTGFSPNGDGINDVVYVRGYGIETMTFRIFNRWGEKVFETSDKNEGWNGTYKNVKQEMEAYQYTLSVTFFDGSKTFKKGNITLLR